jgi:tetratricopeptide (TPR) repeat protein
MTEMSELGALFRDAYGEAAFSNLDMSVATAALERARAGAGGEQALVETAGALNGVVAMNVDNEALCAILRRLRDGVVAHKVAAEVRRLRGIMERDEAAGLSAWLEAIVGAIAGFYFALADQLVRADVGPVRHDAAQIADATAAIALVSDSRWRECRPLYARLGIDPRVSAPVRARLLAILAEIDSVVFYDSTAARAHLEHAEVLSPTEWRVAFAEGRMHEQLDTAEDIEAAHRCFERANKLARGRDSAPHIHQGNLRLRAGDLAACERSYVRGTECPNGPAQAYVSLIELAGHPARFAERRASIGKLVRCVEWVACDKQDICEAMLAAAEAMRANQAFDHFLVWIDRAIELDPLRIRPYLSRGYARLDLKDFAAARADFTHVTKLADGAVDGWWALANLAEEEENWAEFRDYAVATLRRAPDWRQVITNRLEGVAGDLLSTDTGMARTIYEALRDTIGVDYEAAFRNRLGNVSYYKGDYRAAADCYRLALKAAPDDARYAASLAMALEQVAENDIQADFVEALAMARVATAHEPESEEYRNLHARLATRAAAKSTT